MISQQYYITPLEGDNSVICHWVIGLALSTFTHCSMTVYEVLIGIITLTFYFGMVTVFLSHAILLIRRTIYSLVYMYFIDRELLIDPLPRR